LRKNVLQTEKVNLRCLPDALAAHRLDTCRVGEDRLRQRQNAAKVVPLKLEIGRESHDRHGSIPQTGEHARVAQLQGDEVGPPAGGQALKERLPGAGLLEHRIGTRSGVKGKAASLVAVELPAACTGGRDGTDKITQRHEQALDRRTGEESAPPILGRDLGSARGVVVIFFGRAVFLRFFLSASGWNSRFIS
jgi:hypothetical protein